MRVAKSFIVTGRVQGVYFRATTQTQARALGLVGWVMNLPSGQVEGVVCGTQDAVNAMLLWLAKGPELAKVLDVEVHDAALEEWTEFEIL